MALMFQACVHGLLRINILKEAVLKSLLWMANTVQSFMTIKEERKNYKGNTIICKLLDQQ